MKKTTAFELDCRQKLLINTQELQALLSCGRLSAVKIGTSAGARVDIGKRVLWNRVKVERYLEAVSI